MKRLLILLLVVTTSCGKDELPPATYRTFYMGFTPFPYDISNEAVAYTYDKLKSNSDIINHHFDDGVPWAEALANKSFHQNIQDDWTFRKNQTPTGHKVYVSVTPINFLRTGLASYRGKEPNQPLSGEWENYRFNSWQVKQAYLTYCKKIIDFFKPDYFNQAIEANLLHINRPDLWSDYMDLHKFIFGELKKSYPSLKIFTSQVGLYLLNGFIDNINIDYERKAAGDLLEYSDLFAISMYPYLTSYLGEDIPDDTYEKLFTLSTKPVAIAETGFAAQNFSINIGQGVTAQIKGSVEKQKKYIQNLLNACEKYKAVFVINFVLRDYDQLWVKIGSPVDLNIAWRDSGLIDENGVERPALTTWQDWLRKTYKP